MIRVGILGCANIARRSLAPAFFAHKDFELRAFASRSVEKAREFAAGYNARACTYDELITSADIDLIYCPLPTGLHYEWVRRALEGGKHVLCEKSLACSYAQVSALVSLARKKNLLLMESFQFRFHAQNVFVRKLVLSGGIGEVISMSARFSFPKFADGENIRYRKDLGGGALLDAGAYVVKASTYFLGNDLDVACATSSHDPSWSVDKDGAATLVSRSTGVESRVSYSMDSEYCCSYAIGGKDGQISVSRAYTARKDFDAEVLINGRKIVFRDDHFEMLLNYVRDIVRTGGFDVEYQEDLAQAAIMNRIADTLGYDLVFRYAVFGSAGYLGSQLMAYFKILGVPCDGYDLPNSDITLDSFWESFDSVRYSAILFFAGLTGAGVSNANEALFTSVNEGGLLKLLKKLSDSGCEAPKVVFPSTRLVYKGANGPLREGAETECKTVYARNKLNCEKMLSSVKDVIPSAILRICVPYGCISGHDYSYGTIGFMLKQAATGKIVLYGDGSQRRTFTHVVDICRAVRHMASHRECTGVFNVGGEDRSLREVADMIACKKSAQVVCVPWPDDALKLESGSTVFDSEKIESVLRDDDGQASRDIEGFLGADSEVEVPWCENSGS